MVWFLILWMTTTVGDRTGYANPSMASAMTSVGPFLDESACTYAAMQFVHANPNGHAICVRKQSE